MSNKPCQVSMSYYVWKLGIDKPLWSLILTEGLIYFETFLSEFQSGWEKEGNKNSGHLKVVLKASSFTVTRTSVFSSGMHWAPRSPVAHHEVIFYLYIPLWALMVWSQAPRLPSIQTHKLNKCLLCELARSVVLLNSGKGLPALLSSSFLNPSLWR